MREVPADRVPNDRPEGREIKACGQVLGLGLVDLVLHVVDAMFSVIIGGVWVVRPARFVSHMKRGRLGPKIWPATLCGGATGRNGAAWRQACKIAAWANTTAEVVALRCRHGGARGERKGKEEAAHVH